MHVTVLIPVYNREHLIGDAIDSVIAQDHDDWNLLIVDDGSSDRTVEVVKSRRSHDRIELIQMKHGGPAAAIGMGIEHARGPVITCLGSDDKLMPDSLSAVLPAFEGNSRLGYVWTNWIDSTGNKGTNDFLPYGMALFEALISGWWNAAPQQFFRKDFYLQSGGLDTSIKYSEDVQLALLIGKTGCDTLHIPKVTYWVRIHPHHVTKERWVEVLEDARLVRRRFVGSAVLAEPYTVGLEKHISILQTHIQELEDSLSLRIGRKIPFGSHIRKLLTSKRCDETR